MPKQFQFPGSALSLWGVKSHHVAKCVVLNDCLERPFVPAWEELLRSTFRAAHYAVQAERAFSYNVTAYNKFSRLVDAVSCLNGITVMPSSSHRFACSSGDSS